MFENQTLKDGEERRNILGDTRVIEVSIDESLDPESNWKIGKALDALR
jgi:hypothetical protein